MSSSIARLTLYSLISAIEEDLRRTLNLFSGRALEPKEFFGNEMLQKIVGRVQADVSSITDAVDTEVLLEYVDFGDLLQLMRRHQKLLPVDLSEQFEVLHSQYDRLIATRNRVMHSRPLEYDDLAQTTQFVEALLTLASHWTSLKSVVQNLKENPQNILQVHIPPKAEPTTVLHNLPIPDFDETGFVGRKETLRKLKRAICGVYPVITLVGEGGLGKTSLALKAAYDLLDAADQPFEAIIFVTAKTSQLTVGEITRIKGAINTSIGLIENAVSALGGNGENPIDELRELLEQFNILLIIDNLETVVDNNLRDLLQDLPAGSKILITTRIGLGAYEYPVQIQELDDREATQLLRAVASVRQCENLTKMSNDRLAGYCRRMRNNPLHIKWFVSAVQAGRRPEQVLSDERLFLKFCLSNVYEQLSQNGRHLVRTLLTLGGSYTVAELSYLTSLSEDELLRAIQELMRTNMFLMSSTSLGNTFESKYELSSLTRSYMTKFYPVNKDEQVRLLDLKNRLVSAGEEVRAQAINNPFSPNVIHVRSRSDWVVAKHLRDALKLSRERNYDEALALIERAKVLSPDFYECVRVEALIHASMGNISQAYDCYERAIEIEPGAANARFHFGIFLLREVNDAEHAASFFLSANELAPESPEPKIELARAKIYSRDYDGAEDILSAICNRGRLHEKNIAKINDLEIQVHARRAELHFVGHEPRKALIDLENLRSRLEAVETLDERMLYKVEKIRNVVGGVRQFLSMDHEFSQRAANVADWMMELLDGREMPDAPFARGDELELWEYGRLARLHSSGKFGFVRTDSGEEFFFHISGLRERTLANEGGAGQRIKFRLSLDWMNRPVAVEIHTY